MASSMLTPNLTDIQLRDELETMVLKELLGPGSAEEEIIESPGTRYFVGVLAPRKRAKAAAAPAKAAVVPPPPAEDERRDTDGEILDGDELALGGRDTTQDGTTDQAPAQDKALIPSSFGMTFSLNLGSQGTATVGGVGPVRQREERIREDEDRQSTARLEAVSPWRHASPDTEGRADPADCRRSQLPRSRRPGTRPQTQAITGASRFSWSTSSRSRRSGRTPPGFSSRN